jgi:LysR family transcriptional regulator, low CO2-responsive transcriptional regulator
MNKINSDFLIRHVTLRQLQIYEAVVRLGSYSQAGRLLHLTQPTVSMQIKKLTETIGLPLLEQVGKRAHPTGAGRQVYKTACNILEQLWDLENTTAELKEVVKGHLQIAVVSTAKYFMPYLLGAFLEQHPQVKPSLTVGNRALLLERLRCNEDDLLIMGQVPENLKVEAHPFLQNTLVVISHPDHPLAESREIPLEYLSHELFIEREPGSGTRLFTERLFAEQGFSIEPYMELGSSEAIKQAVMAGLGIAVLSLHNLRLELNGGHLVILDVKGFPLQRQWYVVYLKDKKLSLATRTFIEFIRDPSHHQLPLMASI